MEQSTKFGFNLPSRDSDDIADINQISDNFKIIEENVPSNEDLKNVKIETDKVFDPKSENAQSGVAVAEAIKNMPNIFRGTRVFIDNPELAFSTTVEQDDELAKAKVNDLYFNTEEQKFYSVINVSQNMSAGITRYMIDFMQSDYFVDKKYVDDKIGNISTALDELHAYAQTLVDGGSL